MYWVYIPTIASSVWSVGYIVYVRLSVSGTVFRVYQKYQMYMRISVCQLALYKCRWVRDKHLSSCTPTLQVYKSEIKPNVVDTEIYLLYISTSETDKNETCGLRKMQCLDFFKLWCQVLSMSRLETVSRPIWFETEIKTRPQGPRPRPRPRHDVTRPRRDQDLCSQDQDHKNRSRDRLETRHGLET